MNMFIYLFVILALVTTTIAPTQYLQDGFSSSKFNLSFNLNLLTIPTTITRTFSNVIPVRSAAYAGVVFDGKSVWYIPHNTPAIVTAIPDSTKKMLVSFRQFSFPNGYTWPSEGGAFVGGVYDGTNVWLIPYNADSLVWVNSKTPAIQSTSLTSLLSGPLPPSKKFFYGGVFDGTYIWAIPYGYPSVVRIEVSKIPSFQSGVTSFGNWPSGFAKTETSFSGGVWDGASVWLIPKDSNRFLKISTSSGTITDSNINLLGLGDSAFCGGTYDGEYVWFVPFNFKSIVRIDVATSILDMQFSWPSSFIKQNKSFAGAVYDGQNIWLLPFDSDKIIRVDKVTKITSMLAPIPTFVSAKSKVLTLKSNNSAYVCCDQAMNLIRSQTPCPLYGTRKVVTIKGVSVTVYMFVHPVTKYYVASRKCSS
eukprot:PhF_6_TR11578/c0_g1_i1/m.18705